MLTGKMNSLLRRSTQQVRRVSRQFGALAQVNSSIAFAPSPIFNSPSSLYSPVPQIIPSTSIKFSSPLWKKDRYKMNKSIGSGMFAEVFKALDKNSETNVAVKVLNKGENQDFMVQQELDFMRLLKRTVPAERMDHFSLFLDFFEDEKKSYIVFPLHEGGDLFDEVSENGPLTENQAKIIVKRMAEALDCLHSQDLIHRDVKLENIFVDAYDEKIDRLHSVTLADFGYATRINQKDEFNNPAGTFGYVAPEVLSSKKYTTACDIWSLGVVLFTSLAGYQPFPYVTELNEKASSAAIVERELEAIRNGTSPRSWTRELKKEPFASLSLEGKIMLRRMLDVNPMRRPTAKEIINSDWIRSYANVEHIPKPRSSSVAFN